MNTSFWGPSTWASIHFAAAGYTPERRYSFKQFINSLPHLLPCEYCRGHLQENLKILPLTDDILHDKRSVMIWTYNLHTLVNKQLKKKASPSYQIVEEWYFSNIHNYNSFGPSFWRMFHSFAASYRPEPAVTQAFVQFITSMSGIIPCKTCSINFENCLNKVQLTNAMLQNSHNLFLWSYLIHDCLNKELGKNSPSFEIIKKEYFNSNVCGSCGTK
jgi:hypothetical protein